MRSIVLIRTKLADKEAVSLFHSIQELSGLETFLLLDESDGENYRGPLPKIGISRDKFANLGIFCPDNFAWRCGDYGFYLAAALHPDVGRFIMIEHDVRIAGTRPQDFFSTMADCDDDFLAAYIEPAKPDWFWYKYLVGKKAEPWRCFFPVVRLSSSAIELLVAKRRAQSKQWSRRVLWPNDEGFVATTIVQAGLKFRDLNACYPKAYTREEFSFNTLRNADEPIRSQRPVALFHSVLSGASIEKKRHTLSEWRRSPTLIERMRYKLNWLSEGEPLAQKINRMIPW